MSGAGGRFQEFQFQKRLNSSDGYGNTLSSAWTTQFSERVEVLYLRGGEQVMASRLEGRQPAVMTVPTSANARSVTTDWRLVNKDDPTDIWNVRSISPAQNRRDIDMLCERGVASG